jgi:hypothetical protein
MSEPRARSHSPSSSSKATDSTTSRPRRTGLELVFAASGLMTAFWIAYAFAKNTGPLGWRIPLGMSPARAQRQHSRHSADHRALILSSPSRLRPRHYRLPPILSRIPSLCASSPPPLAHQILTPALSPCLGLMEAGRVEEGRRVLTRLHGATYADAATLEIQEAIALEHATAVKGYAACFSK